MSAVKYNVPLINGFVTHFVVSNDYAKWIFHFTNTWCTDIVVSDAYAKSDVPLISGTVIGLVALLFIIMFIAASFSYRQVLSQF